jgi:hypothetical protein
MRSCIESNFQRLMRGAHAVFGKEYRYYHSDDRFDTGGRTLNEQLHINVPCTQLHAHLISALYL